MASVKLYLDTRKKRKDETYPLKLAVTHKGSCMINLKVYLTKAQWENDTVVNNSNKKFLNSYIKQKHTQTENTIFNLRLKNQLQTLSSAQLKKILENSDEEINSEYTIEEHFKKCISKAVANNTKELLEYSLSKIKLYSDKNLTFEEITPAWLQDFEQYLSKNIAVNSRSIILRNVRTVFLDAINNDIISPAVYPFRKFKIKSESTVKRSLTKDELIKFRDYPCEPHQEKYRDIFMLIFYLIGINTIDLLNLQEIKSGRIEYRRKKTKTLYSILVIPEALAIINKYRGENFLLDVMDTYTNYKDFAHRMNENLQNIGLMERKGRGGKKIRKPLFPELTTYYARHTWATIAASLDIPKETISAALGHSIGNETTSIYIDFNIKKVDAANKRIAKYLKSPPVSQLKGTSY